MFNPCQQQRVSKEQNWCTSRGVDIGEVCFVNGLEVAAPVAGPHVDGAVPPPCHQHGPPYTSHCCQLQTPDSVL